MNPGDRAVALGAQHVLHLHRLDHRQHLAGLDFLAGRDRELDQQPGHRREQGARQIRRLLGRHARGQLRDPGPQHQDLDLGAAVAQAEARPAPLDLNGHRPAVDAAPEQRHAGPPVALHHAVPGAVLGRAGDPGAARDRLQRDLVRLAVDAHHPVIERPGGPGQRARRAAPLDQGGDRDHRLAHRHRRHRFLEAVRKLLGDETGGQVSVAEAVLGQDCGQEIQVVADAADGEAVEGLLHGADRGVAGVAVGHHLGDHGIVEHGDLGALGDPAVDA